MSGQPKKRTTTGGARGSLLAISSIGLTLAAHLSASGTVSNIPLTVLLAGLVGWIAAALAEKMRGAIGTLAILGSAQLIMHLILDELVIQHAHGGATSIGAPPNSTLIPAMPGATMLMAHGLATLVLALLVSHAEHVLRLVIAALGLLLPIGWNSTPIDGALMRQPRSWGTNDHQISVILHRIHRRRGPPILS